MIFLLLQKVRFVSDIAVMRIEMMFVFIYTGRLCLYARKIVICIECDRKHWDKMWIEAKRKEDEKEKKNSEKSLSI